MAECAAVFTANFSGPILGSDGCLMLSHPIKVSNCENKGPYQSVGMSPKEHR